MRIFWDTNILIDLLTDARFHHATTLKLFAYHIENNAIIYLTPLSMANADYVLAAHHDVFDFTNRFRNMSSFTEVCTMDQEQAELAINSGWKDFEDSLQYQSALDYKCDYIITRDEKGFKKSLIPVLTPEQFLEEQNDAT
ncbi:type II toxin-antitoxin system VapC family toxin [Nonlabens antarcticus]|uniref:type II toxin-antitoxin system VapC family toxin n=1 Tax=Nonlabens antarcticus TaxID=392714 RepID=UPI001891EB6E|nr:PIN domain-containing protein [Nonlabens antarcticus]